MSWRASLVFRQTTPGDKGWITSSQMWRICILFIAQTLRKGVDANAPYVIFQNLLGSGRFDEVMKKLSVKMPRNKR